MKHLFLLLVLATPCVAAQLTIPEDLSTLGSWSYSFFGKNEDKLSRWKIAYDVKKGWTASYALNAAGGTPIDKPVAITVSADQLKQIWALNKAMIQEFDERNDRYGPKDDVYAVHVTSCMNQSLIVTTVFKYDHSEEVKAKHFAELRDVATEIITAALKSQGLQQ